MIPYHQLNGHDPDNGVYGDCYRACLGSILEIDPRDMPNFCEKPEDEYLEFTRNWLAENCGVAMATFPYETKDLSELLKHLGALNPGIYFTLGGRSPRGFNHEVVVLDGKIVHDPAPSGGGLVGPMDDGYYWVSILVYDPILQLAKRDINY